MKIYRGILVTLIVFAYCFTFFACAKFAGDDEDRDVDIGETGADSCEQAVEFFVRAMIGDEYAIKNSRTKAQWELLCDEHGIDEEDIPEIIAMEAKWNREEMESKYGSELTADIIIYDMIPLDEETIGKIDDNMKEWYHGKLRVSDGFSVTGQFTITGSDGEYEREFRMRIIKLNSKWFVFQMDAERAKEN